MTITAQLRNRTDLHFFRAKRPSQRKLPSCARHSVPIRVARSRRAARARDVLRLSLADSQTNGTLARRMKRRGPVQVPLLQSVAGEGDFDPRACISVLRARLRRSIHSPLSTLRARPAVRMAGPARPLKTRRGSPWEQSPSERARPLLRAPQKRRQRPKRSLQRRNLQKSKRPA